MITLFPFNFQLPFILHQKGITYETQALLPAAHISQWL